MSRALAGWIALLALAGVLRIVHTYVDQVQTIDEANHLSYAMEWTAHGTYEREPHHPPLRAVYTLGPWLLGLRPTGEALPHVDGTRMLYEGGGPGHYFRNLAAARAGSLPFFVLLCAAVGALAWRVAGTAAAAFAVLLASTLPALLAHGGLVTNDLLLASTLVLAVACFVAWLESPGRLRAAALGLALGLALLAKLSALLFVPAAFGAIVLLRRGSPAAAALPRRQAALALGLCALVVWAGYRFSFGPVVAAGARPYEAIDGLLAEGTLRSLAYALVEAPVPAPEFWRGLRSVGGHAASGHLAFFRGEIAEHGWPAFFPFAIAVKTPLAFLLLWAAGLAAALAAWRRGTRGPVLAAEGAALAILAVCIPATINLGLRHVLPMLPLMAVTAGRGAAWLWGRRAGRPLVLALVGWQLVSSLAAHPHYLGYFNECCRAHPERLLAGSDLDWGQDLQRLSDELRRRQVPALALAYHGYADPARHGLPPWQPLAPGRPVHGWVAVSQHFITFGTKEAPYDQYRWLLAHEPVARIGSSIRLYRIP